MAAKDAAPTITLKCPNCGANLGITADMDVFACAHCGTKQVVRREGGTVSLKVIEETVAAVKANTDRIAAELAVKRLRGDLAEIERERDRIGKKMKVAKQRMSGMNAQTVFIAAFFTGPLGIAIHLLFDFAAVKATLLGFVAALVLSLVGARILLERELTRLRDRKVELDARETALKQQIREQLGSLG